METIGLSISCACSLFLVLYLFRIKKRTQLQNIFVINCFLVFFWDLILLAQKYFCASYPIDPIIFDWFVYIPICFLPVSILFTGIIFANTKIEFKKRYILLFVIPTLSIIMLWTNSLHHLFYIVYSVNINEVVFGSYFFVHTVYTLALYAIGLIYLLRYSIKNSGIFSKQAILITIAVLVPISVNILSYVQVISVSIYVTPIIFTFTISLCAFAILKFEFLNVTPIALQRIVDRISDSYIVLNDNNVITDFNQTFLHTFSLQASSVRNTNIFSSDKATQYLPELKEAISKTYVSSKTFSFETFIEPINKYFIVEVSSIINNNVFLGVLVLFKDVTQHEEDMQTIKNNQDMLIESERFASLGQMIGGIAHNLKTPIMSIAGAAEALNDLITEYDTSIGDPDVTNEDHHAIANDMRSWVEKVKTHTSYMSDIITAVKGQAISSDAAPDAFTVEELMKHVSILMKHDLKNSLVELRPERLVDKDFKLYGNINALVQVIDNLISNAIQSYGGKPDGVIDFIIEKQEDNLIISIRDYGAGIPEDVQEKLFNSMITTKGKNGTGLGLFMSYSNIKAKFNGNITFESEVRKRKHLPCNSSSKGVGFRKISYLLSNQKKLCL